MVEKIETAVDTCPERMYAVDAEASMPLRMMGVESTEMVEESRKVETAVDTCPERMYAEDAEASMPLRIRTTVEF